MLRRSKERAEARSVQGDREDVGTGSRLDLSPVTNWAVPSNPMSRDSRDREMVTVTAGEDKVLAIRTAALIAWAWITSRCIPTQDVSSAGGSQ